MFVVMLIRECGITVEVPCILLEDNTGCIFIIKNQQVGVRTKHIDVRWHWMREKRDEGMIEVVFTKSENNESDILTKNVIEALHVKHGISICEGRLFVYENWEEVILGALKKEKVSSKRSDRSEENVEI